MTAPHADPCPHCGTRAVHGERVSCCSGCGVLFSSGSAFDRHRRAFQCIDPAEAGLVATGNRTDPRAVMWTLPGRPDGWSRP